MSVEGRQRLLRLSSEVRGYSPQTLLTLGRDQTSLSLRSLTRNVLRGLDLMAES